MKFLSDLRLKWRIYRMSEFGRAMHYCMQKPEDWDFKKASQFVVHTPTNIAFWIVNGDDHFAPYSTHSTHSAPNGLHEDSCKRMFTDYDKKILRAEVVNIQTRILSGRMAASFLGE